MGGAHSGHGAAWPLPHVLDSALHAALWRGGFESKSYGHGQGDSHYFGALTNVGPFPVHSNAAGDHWFFPRPADACTPGSTSVTHQPSASVTGDFSSLAAPLRYGVLSGIEASKDEPEDWWDLAAWDAYLHQSSRKPGLVHDRVIFATEHSYGIAIDPFTGTAGQGEVEGKIYSAQYLRLREDSEERWGLGLLAACPDKGRDGKAHGQIRPDLLHDLFHQSDGKETVLVGGQQRQCSVEFYSATNGAGQGFLPLPTGVTERFPEGTIDGEKCWLVKWVLLTPAIWPEIESVKADGAAQNPHPGGWLPNWVYADWDVGLNSVTSNHANGSVMLKLRKGQVQRKIYPATGRPVRQSEVIDIAARLVAAIVPKPVLVSGWTVHRIASGDDEGAKHTHLAVPAGAVYYFAARSKTDAENLAAALNWHGKDSYSTIKNRRSTLMGEKGFGLGVCGTWQFHRGKLPHN